MKEEIKRKKYRTGVHFPMFNLEEGIRIAEIVLKDGGGQMNKETLADSLHFSSKSSGFNLRISSAKHFCLIKEKEGIIENTELAKKIISPILDEERTNGFLESFFSFDIFKKLSERYKNKYLPKKEILANILEREYGLSPASKELAVEVYISSGKTAGIIIEKDEGLFCNFEELEIEEKEVDKEIKKAEKVPISKKEIEKHYEHPITFNITITPETTKEDIEKMMKLVEEFIEEKTKEE